MAIPISGGQIEKGEASNEEVPRAPPLNITNLAGRKLTAGKTSAHSSSLIFSPANSSGGTAAASSNRDTPKLSLIHHITHIQPPNREEPQEVFTRGRLPPSMISQVALKASHGQAPVESPQDKKLAIIRHLFIENAFSESPVGAFFTEFEHKQYLVILQPEDRSFVHKIGAKLGSGSFSNVYGAKCLENRTMRALKIARSHPEYLDTEASNLNLLHQEGLAWGIQKPPHSVITISGASPRKGSLMPLYDSNYRKFLKQLFAGELFMPSGKLTFLGEDRLIDVHQAVCALARLDSCNMLHGDIKTENFLVSTLEENPQLRLVHLSDFGGSLVFDEETMRSRPKCQTASSLLLADLEALEKEGGNSLSNLIQKKEALEIQIKTLQQKQQTLLSLIQQVNVDDLEATRARLIYLTQNLERGKNPLEQDFLSVDWETRSLFLRLLSQKKEDYAMAINLLSEVENYNELYHDTNLHTVFKEDLHGFSSCKIASTQDLHKVVVAKIQANQIGELEKFAIRKKMDIFATGIVLHEMLTQGKRPQMTYKDIKKDRPVCQTVAILDREIPPEFCELIQGMLDSNYETRFTAVQCLDELNAILKNYPKTKAFIEAARADYEN